MPKHLKSKELYGVQPVEVAPLVPGTLVTDRVGAAALGVGRTKFWALVKSGLLQPVRFGKAHPLSLLPTNMRYKFRQSLSPEEDQAFKEGLNWYREVYKP